MDKKLIGLAAYLSLAACAHDKYFYEEDFRDKIPVTSNVIKVDYKFDDNGQNNEIILKDKNTGDEYRLMRKMNNKSLSLERITSQKYISENTSNVEGVNGLYH